MAIDPGKSEMDMRGTVDTQTPLILDNIYLKNYKNKCLKNNTFDQCYF